MVVNQGTMTGLAASDGLKDCQTDAERERVHVLYVHRNITAYTCG